MSRWTLAALVFTAAAALGQVVLPPPVLGSKAYPRPLSVRLNDQATTSVWFLAGDAVPRGLDGIYNPALDIVVRRDTSVLRRFAQNAYGRTEKPAARLAGVVAPFGPVTEPAPPAIEVAKRIEGLLKQPFVSSLGTFLKVGTVDLSDATPLPVAHRIAAVAALTGAEFHLPQGVPLDPERASLLDRISPPVESWCADAFPKSVPPDVIVRHHQRSGVRQTTIAILGSPFDRIARVPLQDLGLDDIPYILVDVFDNTQLRSEGGIISCHVPAHGVRLLVAAPEGTEPALLSFGEDLAGGLDLLESISIGETDGKPVVRCKTVKPSAQASRVICYVPKRGAVSISVEPMPSDAAVLSSRSDTWTALPKSRPTSRPFDNSKIAARGADLRSWPGFTATPWSDGFRRDQSAWGSKLLINGAPVIYGIGAITGTKATIPLAGKATSLSALVGPATDGEARIVVYCDGILKASIDVGGATPSALLSVDLGGVQELTIDISTPKPVTRPIDVTFANIALSI